MHKHCACFLSLLGQGVRSHRHLVVEKFMLPWHFTRPRSKRRTFRSADGQRSLACTAWLAAQQELCCSDCDGRRAPIHRLHGSSCCVEPPHRGRPGGRTTTTSRSEALLYASLEPEACTISHLVNDPCLLHWVPELRNATKHQKLRPNTCPVVLAKKYAQALSSCHTWRCRCMAKNVLRRFTT